MELLGSSQIPATVVFRETDLAPETILAPEAVAIPELASTGLSAVTRRYAGGLAEAGSWC